MAKIPGLVLWNATRDKGNARYLTEDAYALHDEGEIILAMPEDISYGIDDGEAWFEVHGVRYSTSDPDNLPPYCMIRVSPRGITKHIEEMGIPCFPSSNMSAFGKDKKRVYARAIQMGIPCPKSIFTLSPKKEELPSLPIMLKPNSGHSGDGVRKIRTEEELEEALETCSNRTFDPIWQECMPTGDDLRIYMLGRDRIYGAVMRTATADKANLAFNPIFEGLTTEELKEKFPEAFELALKFGSSFDENTGLIALDFLFDADRHPVLGELNSALPLTFPAWREKHPNAVKTYIDYLNEKCGVNSDMR